MGRWKNGGKGRAIPVPPMFSPALGFSALVFGRFPADLQRSGFPAVLNRESSSDSKEANAGIGEEDDDTSTSKIIFAMSCHAVPILSAFKKGEKRDIC